jgi:hypothetical protein
MAKMFYTMDETKAALGKSEDDIRQLAREGKLREFRDGPRLMFKTDQVESLKSEMGAAADQVGLSGDTHVPPASLMDSKSGTGTGTAMGLKGDTAAGTPAPGGASLADDTASAMDVVGLSGSLSGSIGGGSLAGSVGGGSLAGASQTGGASSSRVPGKQGVNVLGTDDIAQADPMAQTHITPPKDQISLEGVGSGSGLLDLTRETDDTSLGAALLDEISPGGKRGSHSGTEISPSDSSGSTSGMGAISPIEMPNTPEAEVTEPGFIPAALPVAFDDPAAPAFALGSVGAVIVMLVAGLVLIGAITTDSPMIDARIALAKLLNKNFWVIFAGGLVVSVILFVVGMLVGKATSRTTA